MDIPGKIVIITGASEGIGRATARCFAEAGAKVILVAQRILLAAEKEPAEQFMEG